MKLILELEGGPPWGFRAAKRSSDEAVFVSQVVTGGKACQAGIRIGDVLENVQDLNRRPTFEEFQQIFADANCMHMHLSRIDFEDEEQEQPIDILNVPFIDENEEPKVAVLINQTVPVPKVETNNNNSMPKCLEHFQHPPSFPTSIFPGVQAQLAVENGELRSNQPYSGGFCGTARDKRRFFELAAAQQIEKPPPPLPHRPQQQAKALLGLQTLNTSQISMSSGCCEQPQQPSMQTEQQLDQAPQLADFVNSFALDRASEDITKDIFVQVPESQAVSRHIFMAPKPTQPIVNQQAAVQEEPALNMAQLCAKIGSQLVLKPKGMAANAANNSKIRNTSNTQMDSPYKPKLGRVLDDTSVEEEEQAPLTIANNAFKSQSTNSNENFCYQYPTTDDESTIQQPTRNQLFNARKESSEQSIDTGFGSGDSDAKCSLQGNPAGNNNTGHSNLAVNPADNLPDLIDLSTLLVPNKLPCHPADNNVQPITTTKQPTLPVPTSSNQLTKSWGQQACAPSANNNTFATTTSPPDHHQYSLAALTQQQQQPLFEKQTSKEAGDLQDLAKTLQILTNNVDEKKVPESDIGLTMMVNQSVLLLQPPPNLGANSLTPEQHSSTLSSSSSSPLGGDASASSTSSSMLVAGVRVKLGTTGLEKTYEDRLHPTSSSLTTEPESKLTSCLTGADPTKKSLWYRQMYKQLHCLDDEGNHQGGKDG